MHDSVVALHDVLNVFVAGVWERGSRIDVAGSWASFYAVFSGPDLMGNVLINIPYRQQSL